MMSTGMFRGFKRAWRAYKKNKGALIGLFVFLFFVIVAVSAQLIAPYDPFELGEKSFDAPSAKHIFGTDDLGRDVLSGVLYGFRVSLSLGLLAASTSTVIGIFVGSISGYFGGIIDEILMRITELIMVIPVFFLAILMIAFFGPSFWNLVIVIGGLSWPSIARLTRSMFLSLKEQVFVEAARTMGASDLSIAINDVLPNALPPVTIAATIQVGSAIKTETSLSFLGLGDPNVISWGTMLCRAQLFFGQAWWYSTFPGLATVLIVLAVNLIGDGLNEALNPRFLRV